MRVRGRLPFVFAGLATGTGMVACNSLSGVLDLDVSDQDAMTFDAGIHEIDIDGATSTGSKDSATVDAATDATRDGGDDGCTATFTPTMTIGAAKLISPGMYELTPDAYLTSGAVVSASEIALDEFEATFSYSMTYRNQDTPGAGLNLFAIADTAKNLHCQSGPALCELGSADGFAVVLRTSKANAGDPEIPYVAVVDARTFPNVQPTSPILIATSLAGSVVGIANGIPPPATFHTMAIGVHNGQADVTIDGEVILSHATVPSWQKGLVGTWGIGAATGQGTNIAEHTVVTNVVLRHCP